MPQPLTANEPDPIDALLSAHGLRRTAAARHGRYRAGYTSFLFKAV